MARKTPLPDDAYRETELATAIASARSRERRTREKRPRAPELAPRVQLWIHRPLSDIPASVRKVIERYFPLPWDALNEQQRRICAAQIDEQHPRDSDDRKKALKGLRKGFSRRSVQERNKKNAKQPRLASQSIPELESLIIRTLGEIKREGVNFRSPCAEAYRRIMASGVKRISSRFFRKRCNGIRNRNLTKQQ